MWRRRYEVVIVGESGSAISQRSVISEHRTEREARDAASQERRRLEVIRAEEAASWVVLVVRADEILHEERPFDGRRESIPASPWAPPVVADDPDAPDEPAVPDEPAPPDPAPEHPGVLEQLTGQIPAQDPGDAPGAGEEEPEAAGAAEGAGAGEPGDAGDGQEDAPEPETGATGRVLRPSRGTAPA
ncbi:MAG: hypothetical protein RJQ03_03005, partial [Miltoncostaeaceae bacterium]